MGLFGPSKKEIALQAEIEKLKSMLTPEQQAIEKLKIEIENLKAEKNQLNTEIGTKNAEKAELLQEIEENTKLLYNINTELEFNSFGIYNPTYIFANSSLYKDKLTEIRNRQKVMIKDNTACHFSSSWTVNGDTKKGTQMVRDNVKLLLRAFNLECDNIVDNVKISNFEKSVERIEKTCEQISKLGNIMDIYITDRYKELKIEEVKLALDFWQKKQAEKDEIREIKRQQREEAKLQKEIEAERQKLKKEQLHYNNALNAIMQQIEKDGETPELIAKKQELQEHIADTETAINNVDYREANKRAGYVYVISNIGAFGEDMYKIGMTRRLDPEERIDELSDASVPFHYDVHAMIFSDDAPGLETALHNAFEHQKVNKINPRKEFFHVPLNEIKKVVRENFDKTVEWTDFPEAEQYRQSVAIEKQS